MLSLGRRTVSTPELLVEILSHLDMRTLLLSQRVSKQWQHVITGTPALQRALFFKPITASSDAELVDSRKLNPLLKEIFSPFFKDNIRNENTGKNQLRQLGTSILSRPFSFMDSRGKGDREAFLRKGASWRRMLVQQPAALKLGYIERSGMSQQSFSNACFSEPDGVRMGILYDLVYQFMGNSEVLSTRHAFGVYWREPEHDPQVTEWSHKYGEEELALDNLGRDVVVVVLRDAGNEKNWPMSKITYKSMLRKNYRPDEWMGKAIDLKSISGQDWFG